MPLSVRAGGAPSPALFSVHLRGYSTFYPVSYERTIGARRGSLSAVMDWHGKPVLRMRTEMPRISVLRMRTAQRAP